MKEEYTDDLREKMGKVQPGISLTTGANKPFQSLLEAVATVERTRISRLVFEGITRVLKDRYVDDPRRDEYIDKLAFWREYEAVEIIKVLTEPGQESLKISR